MLKVIFQRFVFIAPFRATLSLSSTTRAFSALVSGNRRAYSSPWSRDTESISRSVLFMVSATTFRTLSPVLWRRRSLTFLKPSRSIYATVRGSRDLRERLLSCLTTSRNARLFNAPVMSSRRASSLSSDRASKSALNNPSRSSSVSGRSRPSVMAFTELSIP